MRTNDCRAVHSDSYKCCNCKSSIQNLCLADCFGSDPVGFYKLTEKGQTADLAKIEEDINERDYQDMHRENSPLVQAEDAVLVDSSEMTIDEVVEKILSLARERM